MFSEIECEESSSFVGLSPFGRWTALHELLAERARQFLGSFEIADRHEIERRLDLFLASRARTLGRRRLPGQQPRWIMPTGRPADVLSEVNLFATTFSEGAAWDELRSLLQDVRPRVNTEPKTKRAAPNEPLAFTVLLMLLADRAARVHDGEAIEMADAILSSQAGALCMLAWCGADALGKEDRLRLLAPKATAARQEQAAADRRPIRDVLDRLRAAEEPRRGAPKKAAAGLINDHPAFKGMNFDSLVRQCQRILSEEFADW